MSSPPDRTLLEIQVYSSLDLGREGEPVARGPVDPASGRFEVEWDDGGRPFWVFLFERFQPEGGPPFDFWLPVDPMPAFAPGWSDLEVKPVDPAPLLEQSRMSLAPGVLVRLGLVVLIVFGGGLLLRRALAFAAAPEGRRSAPLADLAMPPPPGRGERAALAGILVVAAVLRLRGMFGESLDLLELSYTPGIGRPVPPPSTLLALAGEVGRLLCLDLSHPPGWHMVSGLLGLAGQAAWLLRLPSLAASLATCWLVWRLFRAWSAHVGLGACAVFAVASPPIYFGQDATPYAATGLVATASILLLLNALRSGLGRAWSAWAGVLVAGFFCHYTVALLGIGELLAVGWLAWRGRRDRRWAAAIHRATLPLLAWATAPVAWCWPHFSTFPTVAGFTRLFADAYLPGRGLLPWAWDFWTVTGGMDVERSPWAVLAVTPLFVLGLLRALRPTRPGDPPAETGVLCAALLAAFLYSVRFYYEGQMEALAGHVIYAFRWVGWFVPLLLGLAVLGAVRGPGPGALRAVAAAVWLAGLLPASVAQVAGVSRPDYEGVAAFIRQELRDRDGLATLPGWFLRGNLSWYLMTQGAVRRVPDEGDGVWMLDRKRLAVEAIHAALPFETTARNTGFDRLWVAVVDERMFGRAKLRGEVAAQALAWARANLEQDGAWRFDRIELFRFRRRTLDLGLRPGVPLRLSSARAVMQYRTWPPPEGRPALLPEERLGDPPVRLGPTVLYQSTTNPGCVDWHFQGLGQALQPEAPHHWFVGALVPLADGAPLPEVRSSGPAQVGVERAGDAARITAVGGPCDGPPLELEVLAR